ncbi:MAG: hypothetical protein QOK48_2832 [Blastocatellia bacterium]|jgi:uncharacterized protein YecT (DUF1311 family)|nr:hypothetical protein [Blastocatellia bacterium]
MKFAVLILFVSTLFVTSAFAQGAKKPPCSDADTQAEMNICAGKEYKAADADLNRVYQQLVAKLEPEEKAQLKDVQTSWLKYRDSNCGFVADQYKGGSIRPMILGLCLADVTHNRTAELKAQIKDRSN